MVIEQQRQDSCFEVIRGSSLPSFTVHPLEDEEHSNPRMNFREIH